MDIQIHPEWKFNKENYDADIAVVTLFGPVDVTETVQPICLPEQNDGVLIAQDGVVVCVENDFFTPILILKFLLGRSKHH